VIECTDRMGKDFDRWNAKKKDLNEKTFNQFVHEREVWWCALGANVGVEADGKHDTFERPVLVLRKFNKDSVLVAPLTSRAKLNPYQWPFHHDGQLFAAVFSQIRLVSTKRLLRKMYRMDARIFLDIKRAILVMLRDV
jgi:mRNA interferase MazF